MKRLATAVLLAGVALGGCVEPGSQGGMGLGSAMGTRASEAPRQSSFTCSTCGGTYAQAGNCPKCGLELVPKDVADHSNEK